MKGKLARKMLCAFAITLVFAAGCDNKKASSGNFKTALQTYFDKTPLWLTKDSTTKTLYYDFGLDAKGNVSSYENDKALAAEALKSAGLLTSRIYVLTSWGVKISHKIYETIPGHPACYAYNRVKSVDNFTAPADLLGHTVSEVTYTYTFDRVEDWAKSTAIQNAIPLLKGISDGTSKEGKIGVMLTNNGWEVISNN